MDNVYLCGPITALVDDGIEWREYITPKIKALGLNVIDPTKVQVDGHGEVGEHKAYYKKLVINRKLDQLKKEFQVIIDKDLDAVKSSRFIIFSYDPSTPMVGSIEELVLAKNLGHIVLMHCEESKIYSLNPWILNYIDSSSFLYTDWNALIGDLKIMKEKILLQ